MLPLALCFLVHDILPGHTNALHETWRHLTPLSAMAQESLCLAAPASVLPALAAATALTALRIGDAGLLQVCLCPWLRFMSCLDAREACAFTGGASEVQHSQEHVSRSSALCADAYWGSCW